MRRTLNFARRDACFTCSTPRGSDALPAVPGVDVAAVAGVVIQGIEAHMDEEAIRLAVTSLGHTPVKDIRLPRPRDPGASHKGFAFVDMYTVDAAMRVVAMMDGQQMAGQARRVRVSMAREKERGAQAGGGVSGLAAQMPELADTDAREVAEAALSAWQPKEFGVEQPEEEVARRDNTAAVAQTVGVPHGYVLDPRTGYFFCAASGYYWDSASGLYGHAATGMWYSLDAATGAFTAITPAADADAAAAGSAQPQAVVEQEQPRKAAAVIGSAPKLSAEALALREEEQRRAAAAAAAAAAAPVAAAPVRVLPGGKVYGGKIRTPKEPPKQG